MARPVEPRTVALIVGVLFLQLGFILSCVDAFHAPKPHEIPVAAVAPAPRSAKIASDLDNVHTDPLRSTAVASLADGE